MTRAWCVPEATRKREKCFPDVFPRRRSRFLTATSKKKATSTDARVRVSFVARHGRAPRVAFPFLTRDVTQTPATKPPQTTEQAERAREGVSPTAATTTEKKGGEETARAAEASPIDSHTAIPGDVRPGEDERLRSAEARERREVLDEEDAGTVSGRVKGDARDDDANDDARQKDDGDAAATERSPRGATRDRPDDEPSSGVSASRASKKPRLVWTPELHMRFMNAVNHLGIKHAVPKTILQLMNVEGMTRENVASHLQKYRLYLKRLAGLSPNAPLPADIMQRAQPYTALPGNGNGAGVNVPFMPTMEQMHAGLPPTQPPAGAPGMPNPNANHPSPAMGSFMAGMGGMPGGPPGVQTGMAGTIPFAPFGGAPPGPGPAHVALGVSDPYGAAAQQRAQQAYAAAGFGQFLHYMHGLQTSGYGAMPAGAMPPSGQGPSASGAQVTSAGDDAWQAGGGPPAAGAETKDA